MTSSKNPDVPLASDETFELLIQIWIRFIVAFSCLLVFFVDPVNYGIPRELTHMLLISYCLYSASFVFLYDMETFRGLASKRAVHWNDALFFSCLIAFTGGADSMFFFFLFFPIIVSSFSMGFREGQLVSLVAVILFTIVGLLFIPPTQHYDMAEGIIRPIILLVFGHMIAFWGEGRIVLKRRLGLLHDISTNWNPRFGVDHALMVSLNQLVGFFNGSRGIVVLKLADPGGKYVMYSADRRKSNASEAPVEIAHTTAKELLAVPRSIAVSYQNHRQTALRYLNKHIAFDVNTMESAGQYLRMCETLSNLFDDASFISVPFEQPGKGIGRIYVVMEEGNIGQSDVAFAKQVADTISAVTENMLLIENLVQEAEGRERHRISLDVHDTTIQPYIALTLALDALTREFSAKGELKARIQEIIDMANMTVKDLRSYKDTLREKSLMRGEVLMSAVRNQAERLHQFYGIQVEVHGAVDPNLPGRIAEACFQIVKEGLSNILRHTNAKRGYVSFSCANTHIALEIGNEVLESEDKPLAFKPKSITERAESLNGSVQIGSNDKGYTVISVSIPLIKE